MTETALSNLVAWILQSALLALTAGVVTRLVHIDAPVVRYAGWRVVLVTSLALPVIQPWQAPDARVAEISVRTADEPAQPLRAAGLPGGPAVPVPPPSAGPQLPSLVAAILIAGTLLRLAWMSAGLVRLRRLRRTGVRAAPAGAPDFFQALTDEGAEVRHVALLRQPVTFGVARPVVLLPAAMPTMSPGVQRAVLAHELWHVRRRDWLWSLGEEILCAALWFNPAIWYLVARVQSTREEVVDELSILSTNSRRSYLEALLAFADEPAVYPAAPFIRRRQLFTRMLLISKEAVMSSRRIVASSAGMAGVLVLTGWYSALAFPLTADAVAEAAVAADAQSQAQPRDPRPGTPRPATSREQELRAATAAAPSNVKNWLELAKLQENRGATDDAEATLKSAMNATSHTDEVVNSLARFYGRTGQFDKAVGVLEDIAARNPGDASAQQLVATYYWEKAQKDHRLTPAETLMYIDSGIAASDRAIALDSEYVEALTYKNILLRMKGNLETNPARKQQLYAEADALRNKAMSLAKSRPPRAPRPGEPAPPPPPPPPTPPERYQVDGQVAVRIGGEIKTPKKLRDVRPVYPEEAQAARVSGMVIVEAVIDTHGMVRSTSVLRSIPLLDQAALDAVQQWQFTPTLVDGAPVPVIMTVTVNFTLQ